MDLTNLPPIFAKCTGPAWSYSYQMDMPWVCKGHIYATDGKIAVRVPTNLPDDPPPPPIGGKKKEWPPAYSALKWDGDWLHVELPDAGPEQPRRQCKDCGGKGTVNRCGECDGTGEVECDYNHMHACDECGGTGKLPGPGESCGNCGGDGTVPPPPQPIWVVKGRVALADNYIRLLHDCGARLYIEKTGGKSSPLRFTVGECEGLVMPMNATPVEACPA
jgi:hypothetical protein